MKKKQPVYKRLDTVPVLFTDQSEYSPQIFDITDYPSRLTAGKNILRFRGNSANLARNAPLDIEILDYNGEPIYHEVTNYIAEDKSRVVVIYIYPDTSPGPATLTLLTEVQFINGQQVPSEWSGTFNVRWTKTVYVNPTLINESEIIFEELPTIEIEEQIGVQLNRNYSISQFPTYNTGTVKYVSLNNTPTLIVEGGAFSASMVGGTVTVNTPINPVPSPRFTVPTIPYSSTIKKVLNTASILLNTEYVIAASQSIFPHTYTKFDSSAYQITYEQTPVYAETQNSESYAIIKINNLQPLTGDISRIKTYINNTGTVGTWEQISDVELDETEIFVTSTSSITPDNRIGTISNQLKINTYYTSSDFSNKSLLGTASLTYDTNILNNSMRITGSGDVTIVQIKNNFAGSFIKDAEYKITLDAVAQKIGTSASMSIYLSGSAFNLDVTDKYNNEFPVRLGKRVGQLQLNTNEITKRYDDQTFSFIANETGTGVLIFVIEGGYWYISDIRTTSDNDSGYTPNYTRIRALVPTAHKSNVQLDFKIEYYNSAGVKCKQENYVKAVAMAGGNRYVDGDYSMLTGSLYVADSLESGIAISGYSDSGFIRSLGYDGFIAGNSGFLLWSGSALTGQLTKYNNPYAGVGLEMYVDANNYFRYSTSDNELDIHTQTFFLGSSTSYISGSNGNIQISGSNIGINTENFFLGNSTNFISGSNGNILISGSNVAVSTPKFFLGDNNNFVSGSNGNIKISGSNVSVATPNFFLGDNNNFISGSGGNIQISGSNVEVQTPNFFLGDTNNFISGSGGNILISGSNVDIETPSFFLGDNNNFVSGSNGNLQISSSKFVLKANGDITASNMYLTDVAYADGFVFTTAVITDLNKNQYFQNYTVTGLGITGSAGPYSRNLTKIILNGSLGGVTATQARLETQPDWPIGMIIPAGYSAQSSNGYNVVIENFSLTATSTNGTIFFCNAVSDQPGNKFDFSIHSDPTDVYASAFTARALGSSSIRGVTDSSLIWYGKSVPGFFNTTPGTYANEVLEGQTLALNYGALINFQRTTNGNINSSGWYDSYWKPTHIDDTRGIRQYFGGGLKLGNQGMLIGGTGNAGSAIGNIHFTSPHPSAILQLDAGQSTTVAENLGSGSVFIPPRITNTVRNGLGNPVTGSIIYNITNDKLQVYTLAGGWVDLH